MPTPGYYYWTFLTAASGVPSRMQVNYSSLGTQSVNYTYDLTSYRTSLYTYSTNKNYQIITNVVNLYTTSASFSVSPLWSDRLSYVSGLTSSTAGAANATQSYFHYSSPPTQNISNINAVWRANGTFSANRGITDFKINELDFNFLGFSYYKTTGTELLAGGNNSLGWHYDKNSDTYFWYDRVIGSPSTINQASAPGYLPVGGPNGAKTSNIGYRLNNAIYKFVPYTLYNLSFNYQNTGSFPLRIYSSNAPILAASTWTQLVSGVYTPPSNARLLATLGTIYSGTYSSVTYSIPVNFYGISGNKYLLFVGGFAGVSASTSATSSIYIKNLILDGGYHPGNNRRYPMTNYSTYSVPTSLLVGATYSAIVGSGNTINATSSLYNPGLNRIYAKIGNGKFNAGIWQNGVWNTGWRVDDNMYEFTDVRLYFNYNFQKRWRVEIQGPTSSVSQFNVGDNVSISNIVAVDINDDRKVIKNYYTIINKTLSSIIVEFDNNFPLRRVKKDSDHHRIYVTKNIWLSGGFLNGYFTGIWNYGLFKGYPLITEMYNSHWIDGIFDGGHFYSESYVVPDFTDTIYRAGKVGLTFSSPHGLAIGDTILIDKFDKTINPQYDGDQDIIDVPNKYQIVVDLEWGMDSNGESGSVTIDKAKGLVQKMNFKSNNISKITSSTSLESNAVFVYNSWMDVVFDSDSATNIGKPQTQINNYSLRTYSENNLYGYITKDILESDSTFRDSYSLTSRSYRLGTKHKIFADFIGSAGSFEDEFGNLISKFDYINSQVVTAMPPQSLFLDQGWTYSQTSPGSITFSKAMSDVETSTFGEELKVQTFGSGGILDIVAEPVLDINGRTTEEVQKLRYTKIEFDLITYSNVLSVDASIFHPPYYFKYYGDVKNPSTMLYSPHIHFNNVNSTTRNFTVNGVKSSIVTNATYLPVYSNVNHLLTRKTKKEEFFYNKRNLSMYFTGYSPISSQLIEYYLDNLHFYEVDMIPFFQYFTSDNINRGIMVPYQGVSPFIDYTNANFNFIENISIGLDSIQTQNSNTVVSGVAPGVGSGPPAAGTIYNTISIGGKSSAASNNA